MLNQSDTHVFTFTALFIGIVSLTVYSGDSCAAYPPMTQEDATTHIRRLNYDSQESIYARLAFDYYNSELRRIEEAFQLFISWSSVAPEEIVFSEPPPGTPENDLPLLSILIADHVRLEVAYQNSILDNEHKYFDRLRVLAPSPPHAVDALERDRILSRILPSNSAIFGADISVGDLSQYVLHEELLEPSVIAMFSDHEDRLEALLLQLEQSRISLRALLEETVYLETDQLEHVKIMLEPKLYMAQVSELNDRLVANIARLISDERAFQLNKYYFIKRFPFVWETIKDPDDSVSRMLANHNLSQELLDSLFVLQRDIRSYIGRMAHELNELYNEAIDAEYTKRLVFQSMSEGITSEDVRLKRFIRKSEEVKEGLRELESRLKAVDLR